MSDRPASTRSTATVVGAVALGLAATGFVLLAALLGGLVPLDHLDLDFRFRHLHSAPACERLVHVDIDDNSLSEMGRWPWPRSQTAGVVAVLDECGADTILLDMLFAQPQPVRFVSDAEQIYVGETGELLGQGAPPVPVFDDAELARVVRLAGNVIVPMHVEPTAALADREQRIDDLVGRRLAADPDASLAAVSTAVRAALADRDERDEERIRRAYLRRRALRRLGDLHVAASCPVPDGAPGRAVAPLSTLAAASAGSGFVDVEPDGDGVVRRVDLLKRADGRPLPYVALTLAARQLARTRGGSYELACDRPGQAVVIRFADGTRRAIPTYPTGRMIVNWVPRTGPEACGRISVLEAAAIWRDRQALERNTRRMRLRQVQLVNLLPAAAGRLAELLTEADRLESCYRRVRRQYEWQILFDPAHADRTEVDALERQTREVETSITAAAEEFRDELDFYLQPPGPLEIPSKATPQQAEALRQADRTARHRLAAAKAALAEWNALAAENVRIAGQIASNLARLREKVDGRICLVGSTATTAPDFFPTPMARRCPGVDIHANAYNTIVTGAFVREAPSWVIPLAIVAIGLTCTLVAAARPVLWAAILAVVEVAGWTTAAYLWWFPAGWFVPVIAPAIAAVAPLLVVGTYRQLTEERAKREIRRMFAHALSPALVDQLIADPKLAQVGGQRREITCFFSDLAGFTAISERLGEQQTVRVLNRYFDHMTAVIQDAEGGYLNKFLGDGILALFGAPVIQVDHAARSLRAAIACQAEVTRLNDALAEEWAVPAELCVRIGLATGDVMVGNCGSTSRLDYTAIGDTVNLASRLESANKYFRTGILAAGETWHAAGLDGVLARRLGRVVVVGKAEPVEVFHVAGWASDLRGTTAEAFDAFAPAVEAFENGDFAAAAGRFDKVLALLPDDGPSRVLAERARALAVEPPTAWDGCLRLEQK